MNTPEINIATATGQIYAKAFELLEQNRDGLRWTDLNKMIQKSNPNLHPKTINGCVWKLIEKYSEWVYKTDDKIFRLIKFKK